ncbi:MAG TPA: S9 family peptidase [Gemmataceae bacterium]|jgi:dipeptidyl aminopeptidase/acylaminoacyl peptidase|nr:S9 family peptidase [Gemmataceae bacterium]
MLTANVRVLPAMAILAVSLLLADVQVGRAQPASEGAAAKAVGNTPLIPRSLLFGNPDKAAARISPDGKHLSYLAPVDGVLNVWVAPVDDLSAAKAITHDKKRGIRSYNWAYTNKHILYVQDANGDEDFHVYRADLDGKEDHDLTPLKKVRAEILEVGHKFPNEILIGLNDRDPQYHDVYRLNLDTGKRELVQKNEEFIAFITDDDYHIRFGLKFPPDGGSLILAPDGKGGWKEFLKISMEDSLSTNIVGFDKEGDVAYLIDSRGRDTGAFATLDLKSSKETVIAADPRADVGGVMMHPTKRTIEGVSFTYERTHWKFMDPDIEADFKKLAQVADGDITVTSRSLDDKTWIVVFRMDNSPTRYYHYDRTSGKARFLFTDRKALEGQPLVKMHPQIVKSRDNLDLVCYLSLPPGSDPDGKGRPAQPVPMVLDVHGGPWGRDLWGFDPEHQLLANRGYAVLSVNFRGSTGFGKKFLNAGNREWAGKMHDDLIDAVDWAIKEKIALPDKVAIFGGSYGGYATLVGMTFTPEKFACGVDIVGPSNLVTLLNTIPPYWAPAIQLFKDRVGDHTTTEGKKFLAERSPLTYVAKIRRPLLIGQGANDPRVKQAESDQIVKAMQEHKIPVTYVLFPDEGHGFHRPENALAFNAVAEAFLAQHLGGRYEPVGQAFAGSTITVPTGASDVPGLPAALKGNGK